jgi:hypothetical protein
VLRRFSGRRDDSQIRHTSVAMPVLVALSTEEVRSLRLFWRHLADELFGICMARGGHLFPGLTPAGYVQPGRADVWVDRRRLRKDAEWPITASTDPARLCGGGIPWTLGGGIPWTLKPVGMPPAIDTRTGGRTVVLPEWRPRSFRKSRTLRSFGNALGAAPSVWASFPGPKRPLFAENRMAFSVKCYLQFMRRCVVLIHRYGAAARRTDLRFPLSFTPLEKEPHPTVARGAGQRTDLVLRRLAKDDRRREVVCSG